MENCIFSVIMPCYNSEEYITVAIESIVNQTYPHWELIIINDGSFDNTLNIINNYAKNDNRIKVFSKENGGYATAVNAGLDWVTGDYFMFLGSDDYLGTDLFEKLHNYIKTVGMIPDMIAFRTRVVLEDGSVAGVEQQTRFDSVYLHQGLLKEYIEDNPQYAAIYSVRDTSRCYKTSLLGQTRYFGKTGIDADGIFSCLICHKARSFLNLPVDGYFWYIREGSVSSSTSLAKHLDKMSNWHQFFDVIAAEYADEITSTEKQYLGAMSHFVVELSSVPKNAVKYRKLIKAEAKYIKKIAAKFQVSVLRYLHIVEKAPLLYSLIYSVRGWVKKD